MCLQRPYSSTTALLVCMITTQMRHGPRKSADEEEAYKQKHIIYYENASCIMFSVSNPVRQIRVTTQIRMYDPKPLKVGRQLKSLDDSDNKELRLLNSVSIANKATEVKSHT
mmetsp:Transcript_54312/g.79669  ORF Transcript_54312/g.79669 Transcript_54312/m.79669 type:complete len:112 (+) Transcript_54312:277-612(+)